MGLYENIRDIAQAKGYSVNRLEKELGWARSSIGKFNKNKPSSDKLEQLAGLLGVSVDMILGKEDSYYIDEDAREMAEFLFKNPEYRVLFSAARDVKREDLDIVKALLDKFREK